MSHNAETDRNLYSLFSNAANSLSEFYSQIAKREKLISDAGQRNALRKLQAWMAIKQQQGVTITRKEIYAYLQHELESVGRGVSMWPLSQPSEPEISLMASSSQMQQETFGSKADLHSQLDDNEEQPVDPDFSDPLVSPVRRSLMALGHENEQTEITEPCSPPREHGKTTDRLGGTVRTYDRMEGTDGILYKEYSI